MRRRRDARGAMGARISYGVTLGASFALVFFFGGAVPYALFSLMALIPVFGLAQALLAARAVRVSLGFRPEKIVRGSEAALTVTLYNRSRLVPVTFALLSLRGSPGLAPEVRRTYTLGLLPRERKTVELPLRFRYRGVYALGLEQLVVGDMFGLFRVPVRGASPRDIIAHPELIVLSRLGAASRMSLSGRQQYRGLEEISMVSDTRKYEYGDPLSRIHWNLTARQQELTTKLFDGEQDEQVLVLLDLNRVDADEETSLELEDCVIHACLAAVHRLLQDRLPVTLRFFTGDALAEVREPAGGRLDALYAALSEAVFAQVPKPWQLLGGLFGSVKSVLLFSCAFTTDDYDELCRAVSEGNLEIFWVSGGGAFVPAPGRDGTGRVTVLRPNEDIRGRLET